MARRTLTFTKEERARLAEVCVALSITFEEFAHFATMRAVEECDGYARDANLVKAYYDGRLDEYYSRHPVYDDTPDGPPGAVWLRPAVD